MKILTKSTFLRKHTPSNVAIPHLLVYSGPILVNFSGQKWDFKFQQLFKTECEHVFQMLYDENCCIYSTNGNTKSKISQPKRCMVKKQPFPNIYVFLKDPGIVKRLFFIKFDLLNVVIKNPRKSV